MSPILMYAFITIMIFLIGIVLYQLFQNRSKNSVSSSEFEKIESQLQKEIEQKRKLEQDFSRISLEMARLDENLKYTQEQKQKLEEDYQSILLQKSSIEGEFQNLKVDFGKISAEYNLLKQNQEKIKTDFEILQKNAKVEFENVANEILKKNTDQFKNSSSETIHSLLQPFHENIKEFKEKIQKNIIEEREQNASLKTHIDNMIKQTNKVSEEANKLADALTTNNKKQGNWGEGILSTILENSGLKKDTHYVTQEMHKDEDSRRKFPDIIVKLPSEDGNERVVIVDSKVSLNAYTEYFGLESEYEREDALKRHLLSIRNHIKELSSTNYPDLPGLNQKALDYTLLFIPIEGAYLLAMQQDQNIWNEAYMKKIIIVSSTTLILTLRMIAEIWKKDSSNKNAMEIAKAAERMSEKFCGVLESIEDLGSKLDSAQKSYHQVKDRIADGKGNLITHFKKIEDLGVKAQKKLPKSFHIDINDFDDETESLKESIE
jgi:DNA recombination protein RmuC